MDDPRHVNRLRENMTRAMNDAALRDFQPYHKPDPARRWVWSAVAAVTVAAWSAALWWLL